MFLESLLLIENLLFLNLLKVKLFRCFLKLTTEINLKFLKILNLKKPKVYKVLTPEVKFVFRGGGEGG